ncbi:MAG: SMC-Scp complex subunit ScpB [Ruminococcaceae bacterium]|nr:SMC-Scp complex subunit ScpB [Oscillospiraceae bacterium]
MKTKELISAVEAVLFAAGEPISIDRLSQVFEISSEKVENLIDKLQDGYNEDGRGIEIVRLENTYQLTTKKQYAEYIKKAFDMRRRTPLSPAALEVLAVISYNQPVTKAFIEQVRGVDCSGVVSTLIEKGLVEERGRLELPGRPLLYGTTKNFLRCFSLSDLNELPPIDNNRPEVDEVGEQLAIVDEDEHNAGDSE